MPGLSHPTLRPPGKPVRSGLPAILEYFKCLRLPSEQATKLWLNKLI
jgi:hypothetical protein